jgi:hypothetical protein
VSVDKETREMIRAPRVRRRVSKSGTVKGTFGRCCDLVRSGVSGAGSRPSSILHTNFRPDPSLTPLAPETPKFSFGDLLVDTKLAPRSS